MPSQYTDKQIRNGAVGSDYRPEPGRDPLSADQHKYVDNVAPQQAAAAQDEALNGTDPWRWLREAEAKNG
jgi:hypothetical protein